MTRPKLPLLFWVELASGLVAVMNMFSASRFFNDGDYGMAGLFFVLSFLSLFISRRAFDFLLCEFCAWYLARRMARMLKTNKIKFTFTNEDKDQ